MHNWRALTDGYMLLRDDKEQPLGLPCVEEQLKCKVLLHGADNRTTQLLWVRIREEVSKGNTEVGICNRASATMKQIIFRQLAEVSRSQTLHLRGRQ